MCVRAACSSIGQSGWIEIECALNLILLLLRCPLLLLLRDLGALRLRFARLCRLRFARHCSMGTGSLELTRLRHGRMVGGSKEVGLKVFLPLKFKVCSGTRCRGEISNRFNQLL